MRLFYGDVFDGARPDYPVLRLLASALDVFRAQRIPVLVDAVPMDVEYLEHLGIDTRAGLAQTVESARSVVESEVPLSSICTVSCQTRPSSIRAITSCMKASSTDPFGSRVPLRTPSLPGTKLASIRPLPGGR